MAVDAINGHATPPRVPAWKKLGLKLKNAQDAPQEPKLPAASPQTLQTTAAESVNGKADGVPASGESKDNVAAEKVKQKKSRSKNDASLSISKKRKFSEEDENAVRDEGLETSAAVESTPVNSKRRKSVAFTPETKTEDGNSAQSLFQDWLAQDSSDNGAGEGSNFLPPPPTHQTHDPDSNSTSTKSKSRKAQSQANGASSKPKERTSRDNDRATPGYVEYLNQYSHDRSAWKFNKSKQTDLLKNIWNIYRIPPGHNEALESYIGGLQGAAARQRLISQGQQVLAELKAEAVATLPSDAQQQSDMDSATERRLAYDQALQRELHRLQRTGQLDGNEALEHEETARQRREKDIRAEALLGILLRESAGQPTSGLISGSTSSAKATPIENLTARAKKRQRKVRNAVDSSSDDSDSDAGTKSSASSATTSKASSRKKAKSSSSSSDSSSSSSSESDSASDSSDSDSSSSSSDDSSDEDASSDSSSDDFSSGSSSDSESDGSEDMNDPKSKLKLLRAQLLKEPFGKDFLDKCFPDSKAYK